MPEYKIDKNVKYKMLKRFTMRRKYTFHKLLAVFGIMTIKRATALAGDLGEYSVQCIIHEQGIPPLEDKNVANLIAFNKKVFAAMSKLNSDRALITPPNKKDGKTIITGAFYE